MKPEKQKLLHDLLETGPDADREETLLAGGRVLRRRRHVRILARSGLVLMPILLAVIWLQPGARQSAPQSPSVSVAHIEPAVPLPPVAATEVRVEAINDEELLALFPNTPVALATTADGKKRLIFPREGDEARFLTRL